MTKEMNKDSLAVVMITLNEGHNLERSFKNLKGWADEIFVVDSYSQDKTVDICLQHNIPVIQKPFLNFGDQWNFALNSLKIKSNWVMKIDPDEFLSDDLKHSIKLNINKGNFDGFYVNRRLWFMNRPLPINQKILRVWRKGTCKFTNSLVNEYPIVHGLLSECKGEMRHYDSPNLEHWISKQNKYTSAEALASFNKLGLADKPLLFGHTLQRRMFIKKIFYKIPFRYIFLFLYHYIFLGAFREGYIGYIWANLRCDVYRMTEYKVRELNTIGEIDTSLHLGPGKPDPRCKQF